jgi:hypothetical protein
MNQTTAMASKARDIKKYGINDLRLSWIETLRPRRKQGKFP